MPVWLLSIFTNKYTWYALGGITLAAALFFGYRHYESLKADAALVPGLRQQVNSLNGQITTNDQRVAKALVDMKIAQAQRDQAVADLAHWNTLKSDLDKTLEDMTKHASASVNPVCLPSPSERQLWNSTLAQLTGSNTIH